jgi:two-component system, NarL family, response regulator LiaR
MWIAQLSEGTSSMRTRKLEGLLNDRERQIAALIGKGYTNQQIAKAIGLTPQTVKNKLTVIYNKLHLQGRVKLAVFALEHDLE